MLKGLFLLKAFNDFFADTNYDSYTEKTARQVFSTGIIYVGDCNFHISSSASKGGSIYCVSSSTMKIVVELCMFYKCSGSEGGAMYIKNTASLSVAQNKNCANQCATSDLEYQFAYVSVSSSGINHANYLSVVYCSRNIAKYNTMQLVGGEQRLNNCNISATYIRSKTGLTTQSSTSFKLSYSSITNTYGANIYTIYVINGNNNLVKNCNIVNNSLGNVATAVGGVVHQEIGSTVFYSCVFLINALKGKKHLISCDSGTISLSYCYYDSLTYTLTAPSIGGTPISSKTHIIDFFASYHCDKPYTVPIVITSHLAYPKKIRYFILTLINE